MPDRVVAQIITAEKAYLTVRLTAWGVSGHSSMPPRSTAIGRLARAIQRIETHPMPARITPPMRQMFEAAAPHLPWSTRFAFRSLWLMGGAVKRRLDQDPLTRAQLRTTFAATPIEGGVKDNVIPERAEATVNVRLLPGDSEAEVVAHLRRVIDDEGIEIESDLWGEPAAPASPEGPAFRLAAEAVHAVLPEAVVLPGLSPVPRTRVILPASATRSCASSRRGSRSGSRPALTVATSGFRSPSSTTPSRSRSG